MSGVGEDTYRVVEVSPVAEDTLEQALNEGAAEGWSFESLHFVTREGSHRPALAYLFFVRGGVAPRRPAGRTAPARRKGRR